MRRAIAATVVVAAALIVPVTVGADTIPMDSIDPPDGTWRNYFGQSVDIDLATNTMVWGAHGRQPSRTGGAYVLEPDGDGWYWKLLLPKSKRTSSNAGTAVAIDGDLIAVGAPKDDRVAFDAGAVYLFRRVDGEWVEEAVLAPEELERNDHFGAELDVDAGRIVVSAANIVGAPGPGRVFVYEKHDGEWRYSIVQPRDGLPEDWFGKSVIISGDLLIVGAIGVDGVADDQGAIYIFEGRDGEWVLQQQINPLDPFEHLYFGWRAHFDGERLAVAATGNWDYAPSPGRVYLVTPNDEGWESELAYEASGDHLNYGTSLVIDGSTMYVGFLGSYNYMRQNGAVMILEEGTDGWVETDRLKGVTKFYRTELGFGWAMAGSSSALVVGAPGYLANGEASGEGFIRNVVPLCAGAPATLLGTPGNDVIEATDAVDVIAAGSGDDVITGLGPGDVVCTGRGSDRIEADFVPFVPDLSGRDQLWVNGVRIRSGRLLAR